jgi:hydrogenase expression/formation protein HypC
MCLGIPGKVVRWVDRTMPFAQAEIEFDGVRRACSMACVPEASEGDYVIVHAGIAITKIDASEAARVLEEINRLGDDDGWRVAETSKLSKRSQFNDRESPLS